MSLLVYIVSGSAILISFAIAEAIAEWAITLLELPGSPAEFDVVKSDRHRLQSGDERA
jgi:hypothetical protein